MDNTFVLYFTIIEQGYGISSIYFVGFFTIGALVMVNLFIGVILETFGQNLQDNEETVFLRSVKQMADNWNNVDKTASRLMLADKFWNILTYTPYPAGFSKPDPADPNDISEEAFWRFVRTIYYKKYLEPSSEEILTRFKNVKLLVHKAKKDPKGGYILIKDDKRHFFDSILFSDGVKVILQHQMQWVDKIKY